MSFPNKEDRKQCWDSRDRYWECLDANNDDSSKCSEIRKNYEGTCPSQWVEEESLFGLAAWSNENAYHIKLFLKAAHRQLRKRILPW